MVEKKSILFVCTANQCRSPMAEVIMKDYLKRMDLHSSIEVQSAGTWAKNGYPATDLGIKAMAERGLDTSSHKSQSISKVFLEPFDLILTMESGHKEAIQIEFSSLADKVFMLSEMSGEITNIEDPIGRSYHQYLETADQINDWIKSGFPRILQILELSN